MTVAPTATGSKAWRAERPRSNRRLVRTTGRGLHKLLRGRRSAAQRLFDQQRRFLLEPIDAKCLRFKSRYCPHRIDLILVNIVRGDCIDMIIVAAIGGGFLVFALVLLLAAKHVIRLHAKLVKAVNRDVMEMSDATLNGR